MVVIQAQISADPPNRNNHIQIEPELSRKNPVMAKQNAHSHYNYQNQWIKKQTAGEF